MSEEERGEQELQAQEETVPESQETEQQAETPQPQPDEGRLGELSKELENLKSLLGKQGQELGQLRNENAYYRQGGQQQGFQQPAQVPQQAGRQVEEDYDWTDPKHVDKRIESKMTQVVRAMRMEQAQGAFRRGSSIMERDRDVFKGIEQDVAGYVQGMFAMSPNMPVAWLEDPASWYGVADVLRGRRQRMNPQSSVRPVSPTQTETPSASRPGDSGKPSISFVKESSKKLIRDLGFEDETEAAKLVEAERKGRNS